MKKRSSLLGVVLGAILATLAFPAVVSFGSNHREAPITALDRQADITDLYAFRSYGQDVTSPKVTIIMCVDPFLEPANGPTWFPFDPRIVYRINIDNNHDALPNIAFEFRFSTQFNLPGVYTALAGFGDSGANAPGTSTLGGTAPDPRLR